MKVEISVKCEQCLHEVEIEHVEFINGRNETNYWIKGHTCECELCNKTAIGKFQVDGVTPVWVVLCKEHQEAKRIGILQEELFKKV